MRWLDGFTASTNEFDNMSCLVDSDQAADGMLSESDENESPILWSGRPLYAPPG